MSGRRPTYKNSTSEGPLNQSRKSPRDEVILEYLPLVKAIAVGVHRNLPAHVDLEDLMHAGILGLIDAVSKYKPEKNVPFPGYARHRIKGAILDSLRQLDWVPNDARRRMRKAEAAAQELLLELQRTPTESEIADKMGVDVARWRQMMMGLQGGGLVSLSGGADQEDMPAPDCPAEAKSQPDHVYGQRQLREAMSTAMLKLPVRYQQVVVFHYAEDMTMREIGEALGIDESRASQIHRSALDKMAVALQSAGIHASNAF